ncbi:MAG: WYL domain-containing protein [Mariniphaga sp.]
MSYQVKIKRYLQILQLTGNQSFPSIFEMADKISETGIKVSVRQLKRDLESLRDEFGLNVKYSTGRHGYFVKDDQLTFPYLLKILEYSQNAEILKDYLKEGSNLFEIIEFEDFNSFKGIQWIKDFTLAIKICSELIIRYKRFDSEEIKEYKFHPYLLREYLNRWYVVGTLSDTVEIRTFGLDRIVDFQLTGEKFIRNKEIDIPGMFKKIIGIQVSTSDKVETFELECQPYMGNLLKTLPLHTSQLLVNESPDKITFSYRMIINLELKQRLIMISNQAKITKPLTLKKEIENMLAEALKFYKRNH